jgi:FKBP-type peptidyl-prolyl cis-trans isomerase FkpA
MKKVIFNPFAIFLLVAMTSFACSSKFSGYDKTETGLYYKMYHVSKDTIKPKIGDWVSLDMKYTYKNKGKDTVLFDSKKQMGTPVRFQIPKSDFRGDIYEGIRMMSAGDSASFMISADSLFLKTFKMPKRPPMIDSSSFINFFVHLITVDSPMSLEKKEGEALQSYLTTNKITTAPSPSGVYYIESTPGKGMKIDTGCGVKLQFKVSLIDGKQIFSTYDRPEAITFQYGKKFDTPGLEEAISLMKAGSKGTVIVPSRMAFGEQGRGTIVPPYSTIIYNVEILDVMTKAAFEKDQAAKKAKAEADQATKKKEDQVNSEKAKNEEKGLIQKYILDKKITVKPTASGLYFIEKVKGTGPQAIAGKKVRVGYTGTFFNGKTFDSSVGKNPPYYEFVLGSHSVIQGWDEAIAMMRKGGKATIVVPSSLAYGERGMGEITPYTPLVFDVELVDVLDAK